MKTYDCLANCAGYQESDQVWLYGPTSHKGKSPKLQSSCNGPYRVVTQINVVAHRVQLHPKTRIMIAHLDRLAPHNGTVQDEQPY
jgi:hypothetical protein